VCSSDLAEESARLEHERFVSALDDVQNIDHALAAKEDELDRYKESFKPVVNAIKWVASEGPHESASLIAETLLVGCKEAVRRLDGGER
jgi:hypothetical protein